MTSEVPPVEGSQRTTIERDECPVHGPDFGIVSVVQGVEYCGRCRIPASTLVTVEYVLASELERLRAEVEQLREALEEIVDDLSVPNRPPGWAAHALQVAQESLALGGSQAKGSE